MDGKQVIKKLKLNGWSLVRTSGSHHIMGKDGKRCPVPVHASRDLKKGTLKSISKITGVPF